MDRNSSHLILPEGSPPPGATADGFEIVGVEATTEEQKKGGRDYVDLADEIGRKPFHEKELQHRTTPSVLSHTRPENISWNPLALDTKLKGGGHAQIPVQEVTSCQDAMVCSSIKNVCRQVKKNMPCK